MLRKMRTTVVAMPTVASEASGGFLRRVGTGLRLNVKKRLSARTPADSGPSLMPVMEFAEGAVPAHFPFRIPREMMHHLVSRYVFVLVRPWLGLIAVWQRVSQRHSSPIGEIISCIEVVVFKDDGRQLLCGVLHRCVPAAIINFLTWPAVVVSASGLPVTATAQPSR